MIEPTDPNHWLREWIEARLSAIESKGEDREKAVRLLQAFADRTPTTMDVQHQVEALRRVNDERFIGINTTFLQNEKALNSALDSSKTANSKMEEMVTKQLDALAEARRIDSKNIDDKMAAIKDRITVMESKTGGLLGLETSVVSLQKAIDFGRGKETGQTAMWALIVGAVGLLLAFASTFAVFFIRNAR